MTARLADTGPTWTHYRPPPLPGPSRWARLCAAFRAGQRGAA